VKISANITYVLLLYVYILHGNIDQILKDSLQGLLSCEIGGLDFMLLQQTTSIYLLSIEYTRNTYFVMR